ncbi:MAG: ankyrin repeat domain-containing protein [Rickettsiaceae bacterium]|nr:ankyrin repeat domain-containing protein [Rickettsiaceae bacterium]
MTEELEPIRMPIYHCDVLLKKNPKDHNAIYNKAVAYSKLFELVEKDSKDAKDYATEALKCFDKAIDLTEAQNRRYLVRRAEFYVKVGKNESAIADIQAISNNKEPYADRSEEMDVRNAVRKIKDAVGNIENADINRAVAEPLVPNYPRNISTKNAKELIKDIESSISGGSEFEDLLPHCASHPDDKGLIEVACALIKKHPRFLDDEVINTARDNKNDVLLKKISEVVFDDGKNMLERAISLQQYPLLEVVLENSPELLFKGMNRTEESALDRLVMHQAHNDSLAKFAEAYILDDNKFSSLKEKRGSDVENAFKKGELLQKLLSSDIGVNKLTQIIEKHKDLLMIDGKNFGASIVKSFRNVSSESSEKIKQKIKLMIEKIPEGDKLDLTANDIKNIINLPDKLGELFFKKHCNKIDSSVLKNSPTELSGSALHLAVKNKYDIEVIKSITEKYPAALNLKDVFGKTPLHIAVESCIEDLSLVEGLSDQIIKKESSWWWKVINYFTDHKFSDLNIMDSNYVGFSDLLMDGRTSNALDNSASKKGKTPLDILVENYNKTDKDSKIGQEFKNLIIKMSEAGARVSTQSNNELLTSIKAKDIGHDAVGSITTNGKVQLGSQKVPGSEVAR